MSLKTLFIIVTWVAVTIGLVVASKNHSKASWSDVLPAWAATTYLLAITLFVSGMSLTRAERKQRTAVRNAWVYEMNTNTARWKAATNDFESGKLTHSAWQTICRECESRADELSTNKP